MDDLFGDLAGLGIKKPQSEDIFKEDEQEAAARPGVQSPIEKKEKVFNEADYIFDKNMECPVCGRSFKTKKVRAGKARFLGTDSDLRPLHEGVDTVKYDAVVCLHCGYASLERVFTNVTAKQAKEIRDQIGYNFKGMTNSIGAYTYEEAIQRYKLALLCCVIRKMKISERAYVCLKLGWLYRGWKSTLSEADADYEKKKKECDDNEKSFITKAYEGFKIALAKESMPICGMDQYTFSYLMADLARQNKDYDNAQKFIYEIISSRSVSAKVKEKARMLNERIKQEKDEQSS